MSTNEIIKTKNIKEEIERYALKNGLSASICDFKIERTDTYIRDVSFKEFSLFNENIRKKYNNKEKIINEHVEFEQIYHISIRKQKRLKIKLEYSLEFDEFSTHPKIIIEISSKIPYQRYKAKELFFMLVKEINKIKAKNRLLINLFDDSMKQHIKMFVKHLYSGKFTRKVKIPLFEGIDPEGSAPSSLVLNFDQKDAKSQVIEVEKGEVLVSFTKADYGKNGFNAYGQQVDNILINKAVDLDVSIDKDSIEIKENEKRKLYISKKKGFVHLSEKELSVDNRIKMNKLSRVQEQLTKTEDNNIEVDISQYNVNEDSIGEGVKLISELIHITGHVGMHSTLTATTLQVDGATHHDSAQFAKFANINRHKGVLKCHKAQIKLLEGGEVHATTVNIEESLGGAIYAQDVTIGKVRNHLKVYASNSITIRLVSGEENLFKINYKDIPFLMTKINFIDKDILNLISSIEKLNKAEEYQKAGLQEQISKLEDEKSTIVNSAKTSTITIEKPLIGPNLVVFTIDETHELIFKTKATIYKPFYLEVTQDKITLKPVNKSIPYKN